MESVTRKNTGAGLPLAAAGMRRCGIALIGTFCGLATAALLIAPHALLG